MSAARRFPFGGVPVYNPLSLSKVEALAQFHARQAAYQGLMDLLRQERPSHVLIIGTRGMGKTTLLQRVQYGLEDDPELRSRYLALAFPEEQYNVNRLHHFLLNAVDALADAMERVGNGQMLARVQTFADTVGKLGQEVIEERVPKFLAEVSHEMGKSLLLLVDNADRLFDTIAEQEQWRLRELLASRPDLTLFGATTQASEGIYGTDRAFFEFFQIQRLTPLTFEEVRELLVQLSESVEETASEKGSAKRRVEEWLATDAARLRTLVQLTGGNPRTTVMLFHLVLDCLEGRAREYLERLLDQCTPTYKGRVDELPAQAQQVLDAVALRWDPVTAMELAQDTGLETNVVSTQLTRLVRQGILEKADPGDSKKALYQMAERFFNIWYLMRASRRVRAKLRWFVEFLRVFFDSEELKSMAWERLERFGSSAQAGAQEMETVVAYVIASGADRNDFEDYLRRTCANREQEWRPYLDLIPGTHESAGMAAGEGSAKTDGGEIAPDKAEDWRNLARVLAGRRKFPEAETALRRATDLDPESARYRFELGTVLAKLPARRDEAESACRKATELDPGCGTFWAEHGNVLAEMPGRFDEAEVSIRRAIELDPKSARAWNNLGYLLAKTAERRDEAEAALRKAIEIDPNYSALPWIQLGGLLLETPDRRDEGEAALGKALEIEPRSPDTWGSVGLFLACRAGKAREAEVAFRKSLELEPDGLPSSRNLGVLLYCELLAEEEALQYLRRASQLAPADPVSAAILAACERGSGAGGEIPPVIGDASRQARFWNQLLMLCRNYAPFGKILLRICDLVQERDSSNGLVRLPRAVALAQLGDFPRASVALEDTLVGDPIDLLSTGRKALEVFFAAAVRNGRVRDCLELLDKKEWKDAWRPIYEALKAVEAGSGDYLKRVAVEIREPAATILGRIAPQLPGLPARSS